MNSDVSPTSNRKNRAQVVPTIDNLFIGDYRIYIFVFVVLMLLLDNNNE